ncbi:hypothetical protein [Streptomyces xylophagus]|uniref:hypothetical protein n=1 Tax=Streptomyces xylophagus TaxID=285514 RepID=UPI0005BCA415|nr:hypothetical protein [Streptomyces xylophagus]
MGKGKRLRAARQTAPGQRRYTVADITEIGQVHGVLTLRIGVDNRPPLPLALPAELLDQVLPHLREASLHAEEEYWDLVNWFGATQADPADPTAFAHALRTWLLNQDWAATLAAVDPAGNQPLFVVSNFAHVGLAATPPFTPHPALAIIDPMQLRRVESSLTTAHHQARTELARPGAPHPFERAARALHFLAEQPWPAGRVPQPTRAQADAHTQQRRREFLARAPYLLTDEHTPPSSTET